MREERGNDENKGCKQAQTNEVRMCGRQRQRDKIGSGEESKIKTRGKQEDMGKREGGGEEPARKT